MGSVGLRGYGACRSKRRIAPAEPKMRIRTLCWKLVSLPCVVFRLVIWCFSDRNLNDRHRLINRGTRNGAMPNEPRSVRGARMEHDTERGGDGLTTAERQKLAEFTLQSCADLAKRSEREPAVESAPDAVSTQPCDSDD